MWSPLAAKLAAHYTVVVPDLRGMGLSARPSGGYDKKTQGHDVAGILDALKVGKVDLVTHDIGNMVGYAFAAEYPDRVGRFVLIDAPLPGVGPWDDIVKSHALPAPSWRPRRTQDRRAAYQAPAVFVMDQRDRLLLLPPPSREGNPHACRNRKASRRPSNTAVHD